MALTVVGGIAMDSISVAGAEPHDVLGGSAVYAGLAGSLFDQVAVVGAVGDDAEMSGALEILLNRPSLSLHIRSLPGTSTRFRCEYDRYFETRKTLEFVPGVAESVSLASSLEAVTDIAFLASGPPAVQLGLIDSATARLVGIDSIDHWIRTDRSRLEQVVRKSDIVFMTREELREFMACEHMAHAAAKLLEIGPKVVCVKQGIFGAQVFGRGFHLALPAYETVTADPTGAGDSFAGAFLACLSARGSELSDRPAIADALVVATAAASVCVETFGVAALASVGRDEIAARCSALVNSTRFRVPAL